MKIKIAILGVKASFHDIVARRYFGNDIEVDECDTFRDVCESLKNDDCDAAVMAIENTLAGTLLPNYSLLQEYGLHVIGEMHHHIQMCLMAQENVEIKDLKFVMSHPIAIAQCAKFLNGFKHFKVMDVQDTAGSAKAIKEDNLMDSAAIASEQAAKAYGLSIIQRNIETNKLNYTRFLVLKKDKQGKIDGANKTSLHFELLHEVGSLASVLSIFNDNGINLSKIQSIPIIGKPFEYTFILDLHLDDLMFFYSFGCIFVVSNVKIERKGVIVTKQFHKKKKKI